MRFRTNLPQILALSAVIALPGCDLAMSSLTPAGTNSSQNLEKRGGVATNPADFQTAVRTDLAAHSDYPFTFDVRSLEGQRLRQSDFAGRVLIVDFWATWCPPCRQEIPHFVDLQERYGDQGLSIVGLNYERSTTAASAKRTIRKFTDKQPVNYDLALGTEALKDQVPRFRGYPTTLFIDGTGTVRATVTGARPLGYLEAMVQTLLTEQGGSGSQVRTVSNPMAVGPVDRAETNDRATKTRENRTRSSDRIDESPAPQGTSAIQSNPYAI